MPLEPNDERVEHHCQQNDDAEKQQHRHKRAQQHPRDEEQHDENEQTSAIAISERPGVVVLLLRGVDHG